MVDRERDDIFLAGRSTVAQLKLSDGQIRHIFNLSADANDYTYAGINRALYAITPDYFAANGEKGSWSCVWVMNGETGALDSMKMGDKASRLEFYDATHRLAFPDMHSGWVEFYDVLSGAIDSVDIGESSDYLALSPDKQTAWIVKRLGGSRIVGWDLGSGGCVEKRAGAWPSTCETDSALNRMFIVNHFESSVSVLDATTGDSLATIPLGTDEARTDAIVASSLDPTLHRFAAAFPELEQVFVVDAATYQVQSAVIPGYSFDEDRDAAIGVLQPIFDPENQRLFVLMKNEKKLAVFDAMTLILIDTLSLRQDWSDTTDNLVVQCLAVDTVLNELMVGNLRIDLAQLRVTGSLPKGSLYLGANAARSLAYSMALVNDSLWVYELHPRSLISVGERFLYCAPDKYPPVIKYDAALNDLFILEFNNAHIRRYDLDQPVGMQEGKGRFPEGGLRMDVNYPNPFRESSLIRFFLPDSGEMTLELFNIAGEKVREYDCNEYGPGWREISITGVDLPSGVYFCVLQAGNKRICRRMTLLK